MLANSRKIMATWLLAFCGLPLSLPLVSQLKPKAHQVIVSRSMGSPRACRGSGCGYWSDFAGTGSPDKPVAFPPPPPSPQWQESSEPKPAIDLNGTWQVDYSQPSEPGKFVVKFKLFQLRGYLEGKTIESPLWEPGERFVWANPTSSSEYIGGVRTQLPTDLDSLVMGKAVIKTQDESHILVTIGTVSQTWNRISSNTLKDVPCNTGNPLRISADEAAIRAQLYKSAHDVPTAICWFYVAAIQGSADGASEYGYYLSTGNGVAKDDDQAFWWFQRGAIGGDYFGETNLGVAFHNGWGTGQSQFRAKYWHSRAMAKRSDRVHSTRFGTNVIPPWAKEGSGPCDPDNPTQANMHEAERQGYVAYRAGDMGRAVCWFQIGADEGGAKAKTYLGLAYVFGMGVKADGAKGIELLKAASQNSSVEAADPFAPAYLFQFYDHGIGVDPDVQQMITWKYAARTSVDRQRALEKVIPNYFMNDFLQWLPSPGPVESCRQDLANNPYTQNLSYDQIRDRCGSEPVRTPQEKLDAAVKAEKAKQDEILATVQELNPEFEP